MSEKERLNEVILEKKKIMGAALLKGVFDRGYSHYHFSGAFNGVLEKHESRS